MNREYTHTSFGGAFLIELAIIWAIFVPIMYFLLPADRVIFVIISTVCVLVLLVLLFYDLTVNVSVREVQLCFGLGIITKRYSISEMESTCIVKSPWYHAYGIRGIPNGWLYNVSGSKAVEIAFKNKKNKVRIGTTRPEELKQVIDQALAQNQKNAQLH